MQANDTDRLFEALKKNGGKEASDSDVRNAVGSLSPQQRQRLDNILSSPEKMKAFLETEQARALMKKLGKKGN